MKDFDKSFNRLQTGFWVLWGLFLILGLGLIGFAVYVIILILRFFGVM